MTFGVPDAFIGKTLSQIRSQYNLSFRPDVVASWGGINENTPLTKDIVFNAPNDPGSAEVRFLKGDQGYGTTAFKDEGSMIADQYMEAVDKVIKEEQDYAKTLFEDNPFIFDEYAARQSAEAEYEPEYGEMLKDYLENIGITRESTAGDQQLMQALRTTPEGTAGETTRAYERAVDEANQGFAGRGMFFSGTRKRKLGQAEVEREKGLEQQGQDIRNEQERIFGGYADYGGVEGTPTNSLFGQAVQGGINQRRQYALQEHYTPIVQQYQRRYPTDSGDKLAGYLPPEYLRY